MNQYTMQLTPLRRYLRLVVIIGMVFSFTACGGHSEIIKRPKALPGVGQPRIKLPFLGFAIQMGAFLHIDNAIRLTVILSQQGIDAYYFRHASGLFKVRFGDFPSYTAAHVKAEDLVQTGVIDEYYIVNPADYAATPMRLYSGADLREVLVETAERFIGLPYAWGGSSPDEGFDCSGLTMAVYRLNGLNLPRSSWQQFQTGEPIESTELSQGDLVFFATSGGSRVSHVGVYTGDGEFIHAPSKGKTIRVNSLTDAYYAKRFVGARSYL